MLAEERVERDAQVGGRAAPSTLAAAVSPDMPVVVRPGPGMSEAGSSSSPPHAASRTTALADGEEREEGSESHRVSLVGVIVGTPGSPAARRGSRPPRQTARSGAAYGLPMRRLLLSRSLSSSSRRAAGRRRPGIRRGIRPASSAVVDISLSEFVDRAVGDRRRAGLLHLPRGQRRARRCTRSRSRARAARSRREISSRASRPTSRSTSPEDGAFEMYCPVDDHRDRGMEGTITVGARGGGRPTDRTRTGRRRTRPATATRRAQPALATAAPLGEAGTRSRRRSRVELPPDVAARRRCG